MSEVSKKSICSDQIYDGGNLSTITAEELKDNLVAIRQLINDYNDKITKLNEAEEELRKTKGELEFQNTYPYVAGFSAFVGLIGTALVGIGTNLITNELEDEKWCYIVFGLGILLALGASIFSICYRWVRMWFNKQPQVKPVNRIDPGS